VRSCVAGPVFAKRRRKARPLVGTNVLGFTGPPPHLELGAEGRFSRSTERGKSECAPIERRNSILTDDMSQGQSRVRWRFQGHVHHNLCCNEGTFGTSDLYALARAARIYLFHDSGIILHVTGVENIPVHSKIPAAGFLEGPNSPPRSSFTIPTIAAACAWRAVSGVIAIRAYLGGDDPERKGSRQLQRGFKGAPGTLSRVPSIRRRGLRTCALCIMRLGTREGSGARVAESRDGGNTREPTSSSRFRLRYSRIHAALCAGSR